MILDLFFPAHCLSCQIPKNKKTNPNGLLCLECQSKIELNQWLFCPICNKKLAKEETSCRSHKQSLTLLGVAASYNNQILKQAVWKYKYGFIEELSSPLSNLLFLYYEKALKPVINPDEKNWLIAYIPLHRKRKRWRGFNQAEILAKRFSQKTGLPLIKALVRKTFKTPQMEIANKKLRFENVRNSFQIITREKIKNKNLILIDDIAASGATLIEAARILKKSGSRKIFGLVLARSS
jgi:ComF family protein